MKIALLTLGTRGDVQPYAELGRGLQQRGHEVTLSTARNFETLVNSYGLRFIPVDADFQALVESEEGKEMMRNPLKAKKHLSRLVYPMLKDALQTFYQLSLEQDKVLYHIKTMADFFADQFPQKMIRANVIPAFEPTRAFVNPVFSALPIPAVLNQFSYTLTAMGLRMWRKPVSEFRLRNGLPLKHRHLPLPSLYGISPHFLQKPDDYPPDSYFTGFWTHPSVEALEEDVVDFIRTGEPPLLFTLGSMPCHSALHLPSALKQLAATLGTRLVVVKGWGLQDTTRLDGLQNIKVIPSAPYDKLMPHVKAVIHHGGIGTIAACLQAGKPFLACPVLYPLGDQHFWATVAFRKGVALKPMPLKKLTANNLISAAGRLLQTDSLYQNSITLMKKLKNEDGVRNAIGLIERLTR